MEYSIGFRSFEERDVDFIYACKNDERLNSMTVGRFRPFSHYDAEQWVAGVIRADRKDMKFWAICTNDNDRKIIGWESLSEIDPSNKSACHNGLVIGDPLYKDGAAMFEAMYFAMDYVFSDLRLHRLYGCCLAEHKTTPHLMKALGFSQEGLRKDAYYKNDRYHNVVDYGILDDEFFSNKDAGFYEMTNLLKGFIKSLKSK